mgnify:CR=1 FL=1
MPGNLTFNTTADGAAAPTERMRIDSSGRSLFNGTLGYANIPLSGNPANAAIQIRCTSKYNGIAFGEGAVSGAIGMGGADTTTAMVFVANANPANLGGGVHDTFEWHSGTSGGGGPGKYMTLDTSGDLTLEDGDLVIGTSGHGIDFSATANNSGATAEILDEYEEGSFTPTLLNSGSTTYDKQVGKYTKIGNMVWFNVEVHINNVDSSAGGTTGIGLPFNNNTDLQITSTLVGNEGWDAGLGLNNLAGWMNNNDNNVSFYKNSGTNLNGISVTDIGNDGEIVITLFMRTNSG